MKVEGDRFYKVRITPELIESLMTRDASGNLITYSVGSEQQDGFVDLVFQVHYDDNIVERLRCCAMCGHCLVEYIDWEGWMVCCRELQTADVDPYGHCRFTPSRWTEREDK